MTSSLRYKIFLILLIVSDLAVSGEVISNERFCSDNDKHKAKILHNLPNNYNYRIKKGDTLSEIAQQTKTQDTSLKEQMNIIFSRNRHAFINNDKNRIKRGAVLRIPAELIESYVLFKGFLYKDEKSEQKDISNKIEIEVMPSEYIKIMPNQLYKIFSYKQKTNDYYEISAKYHTTSKIWQYSLYDTVYIPANKCMILKIRFNQIHDKKRTYYGFWVLFIFYIFLLMASIGSIVGLFQAVKNYFISLIINIDIFQAIKNYFNL